MKTGLKGENISNLRKKKKDPLNPKRSMSQDSLAELMGTDQKVISKWETGSIGKGQKSEIKTLLKFCDLLGCSPDYLLGYSETPLHIQGDIVEATGLSNEAMSLLMGLNDYRNSLEEGHQKSNIHALDRAADYGLIIDFISFMISNMDFDIVLRHLKASSHAQLCQDILDNYEDLEDEVYIGAASHVAKDMERVAEYIEELEDLESDKISSRDSADATAWRFSQMVTDVLDGFTKKQVSVMKEQTEREVLTNEER